MLGGYMSQFGPCDKCGTYTSVGYFEDLRCGRCSKDDKPYKPEQSLHELLVKKKRQNKKEAIRGTEVKHKNHGKGHVVCVSDGVTVDFEPKEVIISARCLEIISDIDELQE